MNKDSVFKRTMNKDCVFTKNQEQKQRVHHDL